jgi:O-antigen/teichoic acid export membrane protein
MMVVALGLGLFAQDIVMLLAAPAFMDARYAVGPLALAFVANASTQVTALPFSLTKNTHYIAWLSWGAALLNVVLNLWFVPSHGMVAAAWTTALSYLALTAAYAWYGRRLWLIHYPSRALLGVSSLGIVLALPYQEWGSSHWLGWAIRIALLGVCSSLLWRMGAFDQRLLAALSIHSKQAV